ncbi:hypothetical protein [Streptomyces wuyuanensis]|uniref:hypothetical protein n=1 Tax=Streptomyces wuyuanensis TaxID=1196353 RepID=UPI0036A377C6
MPRLAVARGLDADDLRVKRDDLIGLGGGGNKVRKLEWTVADALAAEADPWSRRERPRAIMPV